MIVLAGPSVLYAIMRYDYFVSGHLAAMRARCKEHVWPEKYRDDVGEPVMFIIEFSITLRAP
jgi:hypothetical protein